MYILPQLTKYYVQMKISDEVVGFERFIPIYNEMLLFRNVEDIEYDEDDGEAYENGFGWRGWGYLITVGLVIIGALYLYVFPNLGFLSGLRNYNFFIMVVILAIYFIFRAVAYWSVISDIATVAADFDDKYGIRIPIITLVVQDILMAVPLGDTFVLCMVYDKVYKLVKFKGYKPEQMEFHYEVQDEDDEEYEYDEDEEYEYEDDDYED